MSARQPILSADDEKDNLGCTLLHTGAPLPWVAQRRIAVIRLHASRPASALIVAALLIAACGPTGIIPIDGRAAACAGHPQPDLCSQAFEAVIAELGDRMKVGQMHIDPIQCANGRCWTWAYVTPVGTAPDQQLSIDWGPNGEISVGYVVP